MQYILLSYDNKTNGNLMKLFIGQDLMVISCEIMFFFMISKFGSTLLNLTKPILEKFLIAELLWYTLYNSKVGSLNNSNKKILEFEKRILCWQVKLSYFER